MQQELTVVTPSSGLSDREVREALGSAHLPSLLAALRLLTGEEGRHYAVVGTGATAVQAVTGLLQQGARRALVPAVAAPSRVRRAAAVLVV